MKKIFKKIISPTNLFTMNVFQHGETALHVAASGGHLDIVKYLWSKDIDLKVADKVHRTDYRSFGCVQKF